MDITKRADLLRDFRIVVLLVREVLFSQRLDGARPIGRSIVAQEHHPVFCFLLTALVYPVIGQVPKLVGVPF